MLIQSTKAVKGSSRTRLSYIFSLSNHFNNFNTSRKHTLWPHIQLQMTCTFLLLSNHAPARIEVGRHAQQATTDVYLLRFKYCSAEQYYVFHSFQDQTKEGNTVAYLKTINKRQQHKCFKQLFGLNKQKKQPKKKTPHHFP